MSKILILFLSLYLTLFLFFILVISSKICPNPQHSLSTSKPQNPIRVSNHPNPSKFSVDSQQTLVSIQHYKNRYLQNTKGGQFRHPKILHRTCDNFTTYQINTNQTSISTPNYEVLIPHGYVGKGHSSFQINKKCR